MAATRQRAIVLLWHRIAPDGPQPHEVVPTVAVARFREQLNLLQQLGSVVSLDACENSVASTDGRPMFALTFDDDDARHAQHVLPALVEMGLPATFFLSGRWLHDRGPYWWELLEEEIADVGLAAVAGRHGLPPDTSAPHLGRALTGTTAAAELADAARQATNPPMGPRDAAALVAAGMEIGFHTIDHDLLPGVPDPALEEAVTAGRDRLAAALGVSMDRFAYPHGGADDRTSVAVARAGYRSGWTTTKRTVRPSDQPMLRGRWDVGHQSLDRMGRLLLRGLARPGP